jgi:metal-responsive CopG/Arc/MetJ family transcriptional regulator
MMIHHTYLIVLSMSTSKVAITIDTDLLIEVDRLVAQQVFPNRSKAIQSAVSDQISYLRQTRLARECAKLDRRSEQNLAEEGLEQELATWPTY